jgi:NADPH2 dehydrogenase
MSSHLFQPIRLRQIVLDNRIMVSPMCQYSAVDGCATDWHLMHLGQFAVSGAGLLMVEMTDVEPRGRITPFCLGLYSDDNERALQRVVDFCRRHGRARIGIQLAHAGRKASTLPPWEGRRRLMPEEGGWDPVAPSAVASGEGAPVPRALSLEEIEAIREAFVAATRRAARIGFDALELHCAHGYLLHQFLSPLSNRRTDRYGGTLENRMRFPLEVFAAMRAVWPEDRPLGVRVSATDWAEGGWDLPDTLEFARALKALGCDWIDVSSGGLVKNQRIKTYPGYQVPFAEAVRHATGLITVAIGMITEPRHAEAIIAQGQADLVALARGMLYDPRWAWHAAAELGASVYYPNQYLRCRPWVRNDTFAEREAARG